MRILDKIKEYVYSHKDTALSHLLLAMYHIFSHWLSQIVVAFVGTIAVGVLAGNSEKSSLLIAACIIYGVFEIGVIISQQYKEKRKNEDNNELAERLAEKERFEQQAKMLIALIDSTRTLDMSASSGIYRIARKIKHHGWISSLDDMREAFGFQGMSMQICQEIHQFLHERLGLTEHYATVFQRFDETPTKSTCKIIAYNLQNGHEPPSYAHRYSIPKSISSQDATRKIPYHTRLFTSSDTGIHVLSNKEEVANNFVWHKGSESREQAIEQYIGISMNVCNRGVVFILQIDCSKKDAFGSTAEDVRTFAKQYLYQYAVQLALYYEIDRLIETSNTHELKNKNV